MLFLLEPPLIHVLCILGINMNKGTKQGVDDLVILAQFLIDGEEMLQAVVLQRSAG